MKPLFPIQRNNTILYCQQWDATMRFYGDLLRLPVTFANDWFVEFQLTDGAFLSIANAARATIKPAQGHGITLSWRVDDIALAHQQLRGAGIEATPITAKWGARVLYFHDPEGHRIELWQR
ncbi:MAG: VOC family protein [Caldilineaceae bacterium]|nr:VOC family protein [Caldilineaceae bacterium]